MLAYQPKPLDHITLESTVTKWRSKVENCSKLLLL